MSTEKNFNVELESSRAYAFPPNEGTIMASLTSNSVQYIKQDATTAKDKNQIGFKVAVSKFAAMGKNIKVHAEIQCKLSSASILANTTAAGVMDLFSDCALAPGGLLNIADTITFSHGGENVVIQSPRFILQNLLLTATEAVDHTLSDCYLKPDLVSDYTSYDFAGVYPSKDLDGKDVQIRCAAKSDVNPFAGYNGNQLYSSRTPNLSVTGIVVGSAIITFKLVTFVPISLFDTSVTGSGFNMYGVDNFTLNFQLNNNWKKLFSRISTSTIALSDFEFASNPYIRMCQYIPKDFMSSAMVTETGDVKPYVIPYVYHSVDHNEILTDVAVPPLDFKSKNIVNVSFPTLPKKIYIGVIPDDSVADPSIIPRCHARIEKCILSINGSQSLVGCDAEHLLNISQSNGLQIDHVTGLYFSAFPVILDCRKDLSLSSIVGENTAIRMNIDLTYRNLSATSSRTFRLIVVSEYDALMQYENGRVKYMHNALAANMSNVEMKDIKSIAHTPLTSSLYIGGSAAYGGGFFSSLGKVGKFVIDRVVPAIGSAVQTYKTLKGGKNEITGGKAVTKTKFA